MVRKRSQFRKSPLVRIKQGIVNFFTQNHEEGQPDNRIKRLVLKKNRIYMMIFLGAIIIYSVGLALYILRPQDIISSFAKPPTHILDPDIQEADLEVFQKALQEKHITLDSLQIASNEAVLMGKLDRTVIYFDRYKDVNYQVTSLQEILTRLTIDGGANETGVKKPVRIDLRFSKPVVQY